MDQTAMLIAAVVATWGVVLALGRELRTMWQKTIADCEAVIVRRDARIVTLEQEAREAVHAKDTELAELRKLLITQYGAGRQSQGAPQ